MSGASGGGLAWAELMRLGLGALRLPPEVFWGMTPVELHRALEGAGLVGPRRDAAAIDRAALDRLMARFPDHGRGRTE